MLNKEIKFCVGIIGSPSRPDIDWTDGNLADLKRLGFNTLQLNIAWGCRPGDEPLNIEDVVVREGLSADEEAKVRNRQDKIIIRVKQCKKFGFRSIFQFGAPFNGEAGYIGKPLPSCLQDRETHLKYVRLIGLLFDQIPGIDDILIYTYDQDAWLCSEFEKCEQCWGIPLDKRLPVFLRNMVQAWSGKNPKGMVWWEPWELSSGQVLKMMNELPVENFGLMLHSNIGEVQKTRPVDLWFRNAVSLAKERNIPVIAEVFMAESSEEVEPLQRIPCPRLTYLQIDSVLSIDGVVGVKEYYGLIPANGDPCLELAGQIFNNPELSLTGCITNVAIEYGEAKEQVMDMWDAVTRGYELFPWDVSWFAREAGRADIDHGWHAAFLRGQQCSTPSWESSRHGIFMKTDDSQPHPWMLEDIQLRCGLAAEQFTKAVDIGTRLMIMLSGRQKEIIEVSIKDIDYFRRVCCSYELHLRETNVAFMLRKALDDGKNLPSDLLDEMNALLQKDLMNQGGKGRITDICNKFIADPGKWLIKYLLPSEECRREKGYFSLTTR